jgi:glucose/mannose-6-phosphate isomerase
MSDLDNIEGIKTLDPGGMYEAITGFPEQIRKAVKVAESVKVEISRFESLKNIVLCGMGGSAIGGDLTRSLLHDSLPHPMYVCRNYRLPAYADSDTLVIASSYSGATEETLSAVDEALAKNCRLFAISTGGPLGELCRSHSIPMATLPTGLQPRAALGYSFVPLLLFLKAIGLSSHGVKDFMVMAEFLEKRMRVFGIETPSDDNPAKQLAMQLYGRIPIIYSGPDVTDAIATRIKGQICENAKMLAFANQFPEFNHNELVGWKLINAFRDHLRVIILRDSEDNPRVTARMDVVKEMIQSDNVNVIDISSEGGNRLERMMSLIQFGDFTSFYLAVLNNVDPTPVAAIDYLKNELAKLK